MLRRCGHSRHYLTPAGCYNIGMKLEGRRILRETTPEKVFAALNDAEVLRRNIPGCETLEKTSATHMTARIILKIGPLKATFNGEVELSDIVSPRGYTISGRGSGGAAGFAKGAAVVKLEAHADGVELHYEVDAQVGGKIAQLGARLIDSTAKKLAAQFFDNLTAELSPQTTTEEKKEDAATSEKESAVPAVVKWVVVAGVVGVLLSGVLLFAF